MSSFLTLTSQEWGSDLSSSSILTVLISKNYFNNQEGSLHLPPLQTTFRVLKGGYPYENFISSLKGGVFSEKFPLKIGIFETQSICFLFLVYPPKVNEKLRKTRKFNRFRGKYTSYEGTKKLMCKDYGVKPNKIRNN